MTETTPSSLDADVTAVENLLQTLEKGLRAFKLYLPNNPIYQRATTNIQEAFKPVWEACDELELHVREGDFLWEEAVVWSQANKSQSMAWTLYRDGVRTITMAPGVEEAEVFEFLRVIQKVGDLPADSPDDLLTLLWEHEFERLQYTHVDVSDDEGGWEGDGDASGLGGGGMPAGDVQEHVAAEVEEARQEEQQAAGADAPPGIVNIEDFDSTLYFLDEQEIDYLKSEIDREYRQDLNANILAMLFDLLEQQTSPAVRSELLTVIEQYIPYLLNAGDFSSVALIVRELRVVADRAPQLLAEHRQRMLALPDLLSEPEAVGQLLQSLDAAVVHPSEEELGQLFAELRPHALEPVFEWLPKLTTQRVRVLLKQAAARLAQANPEYVVNALETKDADRLKDLLGIVQELKLPAFVAPLSKLMQNGESESRRTAVHVLAEIGSPAALKALESAVEDPDREVRIGAVQTLAQKRHRGAFTKIEAMVQGKDLRGADLTEKKAFFEAYGVLAGESGIASLRAMLQGKGLFKRKADPEVRACAAMALGKIGTPAAREILNAVGGEKDPLVRNAVGQALRESV